MDITTRTVGTNLEEVAVDGLAAGRIYTRADGQVSPYDINGTEIAPDTALTRDEAVAVVADLVTRSHTPDHDKAAAHAAGYRDRLDASRVRRAKRVAEINDKAASQANPRNYDGYILLLETAGQAPSVYRFDRLPRWVRAVCEECHLDSETSMATIMYRTVPLHTHTTGEPDLISCQACTERSYWAKRLPDAQEDTARDGSAYHMYNPNPTAYIVR